MIPPPKKAKKQSRAEQRFVIVPASKEVRGREAAESSRGQESVGICTSGLVYPFELFCSLQAKPGVFGRGLKRTEKKSETVGWRRRHPFPHELFSVLHLETLVKLH